MQIVPEGETANAELIQPELLKQLVSQLDRIRNTALNDEQLSAAVIDSVHERFKDSARNLIHYLALRQFDVRELQEDLARLGLSSLGRSEAHALAAINCVLGHLCALHDSPEECRLNRIVPIEGGHVALQENACALLGKEPGGRSARIMVTLPNEAATDYALVRSLLDAGMDSVRINCAHDAPDAWGHMIENVKHARQELGRECPILMDLSGPKVRTGPLPPGPRVIHVKLERDARGSVLKPARVLFCAAQQMADTTPAAGARVPVDPDWLELLGIDDCVQITDARGKCRELTVRKVSAQGCLAECDKAMYIETGNRLEIVKSVSGKLSGHRKSVRVGELPVTSKQLVLKKGDVLILTRKLRKGRPALLGKKGRVLKPARISCTLAQAFDDVKAGHAVKFDDGKIEGIVREANADEMRVEILSAKEDGSKLEADKGINFPDTELRVVGLTEKDMGDLDFVVAHTEIVSLSFVNTTEDVRILQDELAQRKAGHLGIVLKIETQRGFKNLRAILLQAMRSHPVGVMIARGDLAVECGWERSAEVQEEILWLCEAAHVPTIWATQVLEGLAKSGLPSRAEITDAAMSQRAECVMLNKGPHITDAIRMLDNILARMQGHQTKKMAMMRKLSVSENSAPQH